MEYSVRIERAENGYSVCMKDPAIVKRNAKRDNAKSPYQPYIDPEKRYVFPDYKALTDFLKVNLDKALPLETYDSVFDTMSNDNEDD